MRWLLLLGLSNLVFAVDNIKFELGSIADIDWQLANITANLKLAEDITLEFNIATLNLSKLNQPLKNIKLHCKTVHYTVTQLTCPNAKLYLNWSILDQPDIVLSFTYHFASKIIYLNIEQLSIADGKVFLQAKVSPVEWNILLKAKQIVLQKLLTKLNLFIDLPAELDINGKLNVTLKAIGDEIGLQQATITGQSNNLNFTFSDYIGQHIATKFTANITKNKQLTGNLVIKKGKFLLEPIYTEILPKKPLILTFDLTWQPPYIKLHNLTYNHTDIISLQANGDFTTNEEFTIEKLAIQSTTIPLQNFYTQYLQTWLDNEFDIKQLEFLGSLQVALDWQLEQQHGIVQLQDIALKKFNLTNLQGKVQWHSKLELPSNLSWSQIIINGIEFGASKINFSLTDKNIKLLEAWRQPIYDGAINVDQFKLANLGTEKLSWQLQMFELQPISINKLLPIAITGSIYGNIPKITYQNQQVIMDGTLQANIFDGNIIMSGANWENNETFTTKLAIEQINLQSLTSQVTKFGEIQGTLSGYINDLILVNWQPVNFDAFIGTPDNDKLPHKISQKAVKALSSLGGGAAVDALSRSILSVFENFYYHKIGLGCKLQQGICKMRGIEQLANNSYYMIKGKLLPRIDVIGYEQNVDWHILGSRLKTIIDASSNANDPIIE